MVLVFRGTYDATCGDNGFPSSKVMGCAGLVRPGVLITGICMRKPKCGDGDHWVPEIVRATLYQKNRHVLVGFCKPASDNAASSTSYDQELVMV